MASGPNLQGNHSPQDNFPQDNPQDHNFLQRSHDSGAEAPQSGFFRPRPILKPGLDVSERYSGPSPLPTVVEDARLPADLALNDVAVTDLAPPQQPKFWQRQPYRGMAYFAAVGGTVTAAWLLGILVAQVLPGNFDQPPLQEAFLRKTSRLASRLWHFPQLWHSPSDQLQIEAIPLPETGPLLTPVELSPIERQPLIDELNSIETELLTLDRRLNALEKQLGRPPYQATDMSIRVNSLRAAIDPPLQPAMKAAAYQPVPASQNDRLLEVVRLKIMLPSDAIFSPGQSQLKQTAILNQVLDQLVNYPQATIVIRAYSDDQGDAIAAREYTLAQANALSHYLQSALPQEYRWITVGGGQSQPVAPPNSATDSAADSAAADDIAINRQRNRRLEILVDTR